MASSIAHINGQKVVGAEAYTSEPESGRWQEYPFALKAVGDKAFTEGINRMVVHRYAMQPHSNAVPAMTLGPWGIHFDRTNTWWEPARAWMDYLNRCQTLLQEGLFVADLAYFTGDNVVGYTKVHRNELNPVPPEGYDYDLMNTETLLNRAWIEQGRLRLPDGMSYRILVLQEQSYITLGLLRKLREMVEQGLVIVGARPHQTVGLQSYSITEEKEFEQLCDELWGKNMATMIDRNIGKGRVFWEISLNLNQVFRQIQLKPDFEVGDNPNSAPIRYIHRQIGDTDVYFVTNQRRTPEDIICNFRVEGKVPEFWNPLTGERSRALVYQKNEGMTSVPIQLDEYGSVFVVFRSDLPEQTAIRSIYKDSECLVDASVVSVE